MAITPVKDMVMAAKAAITSLSTEQAAAEVAAGRAVFVDIRDVRELERDGRLPGAIHAPRGMLEFWVDPASPYHKEALATDKRLVLVCAGAWRSALATKTLQDMGMDNVAEMEGGFSAWKAEGRPVD
ncbi:rhodanese-like domain-containing protein [Roseicyclus persicicus]|uniref:Rhodanese-like domain-containing protein n=1 Tax=Roseicyclus persicicus TaxID=2650661 RepID=A0A7X6H067_9RHOB|nr:rhodanese-like domain-containing protein [Roseibacterium persicicum]NKX45558.1 rhodanese-like domain-containing protein [Roseibacterium persicicum]